MNGDAASSCIDPRRRRFDNFLEVHGRDDSFPRGLKQKTTYQMNSPKRKVPYSIYKKDQMMTEIKQEEIHEANSTETPAILQESGVLNPKRPRKEKKGVDLNTKTRPDRSGAKKIPLMTLPEATEQLLDKEKIDDAMAPLIAAINSVPFGKPILFELYPGNSCLDNAMCEYCDLKKRMPRDNCFRHVISMKHIQKLQEKGCSQAAIDHWIQLVSDCVSWKESNPDWALTALEVSTPNGFMLLEPMLTTRIIVANQYEGTMSSKDVLGRKRMFEKVLQVTSPELFNRANIGCMDSKKLICELCDGHPSFDTPFDALSHIESFSHYSNMAAQCKLQFVMFSALFKKMKVCRKEMERGKATLDCKVADSDA